MKVPDRVYTSCAVICSSLLLLRPPRYRHRPHPIPVPILNLSSSVRPHSRSLSRPVPAPVSVPILRSIVRLHLPSRSRSISVPINFYIPVPAPTPFPSPFPPPTLNPPPATFAYSNPSDTVTPSVLCACTDTGPCKWSCRVPASATLVCRDDDVFGIKGFHRVYISCVVYFASLPLLRLSRASPISILVPIIFPVPISVSTNVFVRAPVFVPILWSSTSIYIRSRSRPCPVSAPVSVSSLSLSSGVCLYPRSLSRPMPPLPSPFPSCVPSFVSTPFSFPLRHRLHKRSRHRSSPRPHSRLHSRSRISSHARPRSLTPVRRGRLPPLSDARVQNRLLRTELLGARKHHHLSPEMMTFAIKEPNRVYTSCAFFALLCLFSALPNSVLTPVPVPILVPVLISATDLVFIPAPVSVPILCSSTGIHPHPYSFFLPRPCSRPRCHPEFVLSSAPPSPFPSPPRPRSRLRFHLAFLCLSTPYFQFSRGPRLHQRSRPCSQPRPRSRLHSRPRLSSHPTRFPPSCLSGPVTLSGLCVCTYTGPCEGSCRVPASATPCLQS